MMSIKFPEDREYTASHEWLRIEGTAALIGLTSADPAMSGRVERVEFAPVASEVKTGDLVATVHTANGQRTVLAPLSGTILECNPDLVANASLLRDDPFELGWLLRIKIEAGEELEHLLEPSDYEHSLREIDPDI